MKKCYLINDREKLKLPFHDRLIFTGLTVVVFLQNQEFCTFYKIRSFDKNSNVDIILSFFRICFHLTTLTLTCITFQNLAFYILLFA